MTPQTAPKARVRGIRQRFTLLNLLLVAVLLTALGTAQYFVFRRFLITRTAAALRAGARSTIDRTLAGPAGRSGDLRRFGPNLARDLTAKGVGVQIIDRSNQVLFSAVDPTAGPGAVALPTANPAEDERAFNAHKNVTYGAQVGGRPVLVALIPLTGGPHQTIGLAQMSTSASSVEGTLRAVILFDLVGSAVVLLTLVFVLPLLVKAALRPLQRMIDTTRTISSGDLSQRLNLPAGTDEVGQLAAAFDAMVERLEALFVSQKQFVADASHELRTPLTAMRGSLDMVMLGVEQDPASIQAILRSARRELDRMTRLVNDLLTLSRLDARPSRKHEAVHLADLLSDVCLTAGGLAGRRKLEWLNQAGDVCIMGDADRLRQLVLNLLDNAIKFTSDDGHVWLRLEREGPLVRIQVQDDGPGIAPADLPRVCDRFFRAEPSRSRQLGGAGLGLAIVRDVAQAHGGRVAVSSQPGAGATFDVWLPVADGTKVESPPIR